MRPPFGLQRLWRALTSARPLPSLLALTVLGVAVFVATPRPSDAPVDFNREVRPILNARCISCHGGVKRAGGFGLLFREDALVRGESGRFGIVPGDPDASEMMRRITHADPDERMPRDGAPLAREEVETLRRWIARGAPWAVHWAYERPRPQSLPPVSDPGWAAGGIDRFVLARLDAEGLAPSPAAPCATLMRRVSLDLVGLPPTPGETDAFCRDPSPAAYERVVDRLLRSPRYGEHWASMWLDLARYGDTKGYEKDQHRDIWSYRDWVIRALNRDLPFDRFTIEQLAGDLLPGASDEQILATAFHRNTMTNDEGGTDDEEFRLAAVIDRVNTTWEVWQGTTMACVQCHSHPYDPFRHEEYYQQLAYFNNTADADRDDENPRLATYAPADRERIEALLGRLGAAHGHADAPGGALADRVERLSHPRGRIPASSVQDSAGIERTRDHVSPLRDRAYAGYRDIVLDGAAEIALAYAGGGGAVEVRLGGPDGRMIARAELPSQRAGAGRGPAGRSAAPPVRVPIEATTGRHDVFLVLRTGAAGRYRITSFSLHPARDPQAAREVEAIEQELAGIAPLAQTPVMRELPPRQRRVTRVFERGNWLVPTDTVRPDVPGSLPPLPPGATGDRLGLARWMVSPDNPLTARVVVNRFWAQVFGTGIVETLEDFGTQGAPPSHPELLDWLALRFMDEHGWSVKSLLREIVLSATYRQSSRVAPELLERDPYNRLLARGPRVRLSAEQVRDQALAVAGLLSDSMYGPSVMPPQPPHLWSSPYNSRDWVTSQGEDRYRRAVYTYWKRTVPYPSMLTFDAPTRDVCVSRRIRTNTPLQALVTLNDPVYVEAAQALARRMLAGGETLDQRLRVGFRRALARDPDAATLARLAALYREAEAFYGSRPDLLRAAVEPYQPYDGASAYTAAPEPAAPPHQVFATDLAPTDHLAAAALGTVASAILNLDGFLTRE